MLARSAFCASAFAAAFTMTASAAPFTEGVIADGSNSNSFGQAFSPGIMPVPSDPGFTDGDTVLLQSVRFASGGSGTGNANTFLAIFDEAFTDFNGPANNSTLTAADAVGISENSFDTTALTAGTPFVFTFGDGLAVEFDNGVNDADGDSDDALSGVFVTVSDTGAITPIAVSTAFIAFNGNTPVANYGGTNNFDATALFGPPNANGFLGAASNAFDLSFQASFTAVPEPASLAVVGAGLALMFTRQTRRHDG